MDQRERLGLGISTAGHVLLFALLSLGLLQTQSKVTQPAAIAVSLADAIALESLTREAAPDVPQAATAPQLGATVPEAAPPEPETPASPAEAAIAPPPSPRAIEPAPRRPRPTPRPSPPQARATPDPRPSARPQRAARLGSDFLKGLDSDTTPTRTTQSTSGANAPISAQAVRALNAEITRQIKPHWRPPSGADAERLVTLLSVRLGPDGRVNGPVEVIGQEGITPSNRAQADLHAERAVQAVLRASPFRDLPPEYYEQWKWLKPLRIYASLGQ
jgi:hypothetical protein